jgi:AraC-like DNA-binding protein
MDGATPGRVQRLHNDNALGHWFVDLCAPRPELAAHVDLLWYGEGRVNYLRDRILPSGGSYLLINLGPTQYRIDPGPPEQRVGFDDIWYSGPHTGPIDTEAPTGNALLGVAFKPCGSHAWLGLAAAGLAQRTLPLADLVGDSARELREQLLSLRDSQSRIARVEEWLLRRLDPRRATHAAVEWSLRQLDATQGQTTIAQLARTTGFSRKHLGTLFAEQVGLSPKALARVLRFRSALQRLEGATHVPWCDLAASCGYFDQSHLTRDFRAFCGFAPGEFLGHVRADATSIVLR